MKTFKLYTDGACAGNPGPGGWAAIIVDENSNETVLTGGAKETTNNIMELTAVIEGAKAIEDGTIIEIYSDSQYVIKGLKSWVWNWIKNGWIKSDGNPVLNRMVWENLIKALTGKRYRLNWVKGHSQDVYNNRCDALAVNESLKYKRGEKK